MELKIPCPVVVAQYLAKIQTSLKVVLLRTNQDHLPSPSKSFDSIVKFIERTRLTCSAFLFWLAKEYVFEEERKKNAHHQAISDQGRDGIWEELKERFGDNGNRRPHEDWNP
jgi:hypothetical protein